MPVTGNSEKLTRMSKLLDKLLKACVTVVKFLQGTILLSNELTVKNILGYKQSYYYYCTIATTIGFQI